MCGIVKSPQMWIGIAFDAAGTARVLHGGLIALG
jgi:hypothetical protein